MGWLASQPAGILNQWLAWEQVEPIGEEWMQTAKILEALYLPIYAKAEREPPDAADLMPERFQRPRKGIAAEIRAAIRSSEAIGNQLKAAMGIK
jgi:hypothetical protein